MSREEKGVHAKRTTTDCWKSTTIARKEATCPFAFRTFCQHLNFRLLAQRTVVLSHRFVAIFHGNLGEPTQFLFTD